MKVHSTLCLRALHAVAGSIAMYALMGAMGPAAALADEPASTAAASALTQTQYTVKPGQSLNDIAIAVTQSHDRAVLARAAKAIFDANPSAFIRGDASLLKVGAVLNVPSLDASVPLAQAVPAASATVPTPAAASAGTAAGASQSAAHPALASSATSAALAPASGAAHASVPAAQAAGGSFAAAASASAAAAAESAAQPVPHSQANGPSASAVQAAPAGASTHAWTGSIQPDASGPAQVATGGASETAAARPASGDSATASPAVGTASATNATAVPSASAASAPHARFSSLQQLLALKNRVLMDLQRHGFGSQPPREAAGNGPSPAKSAAAAAPQAQRSAPQAGEPPVSAHASDAHLSTAGDRFMGVGGDSINVSRASIPMVAAIASAIVAALLVLIVGFALRGRKRRAARAAASQAASSGTPTDAQAQTRSEAPSAVVDEADRDPLEAEFLAVLARTPTSKRALMGLAGHYAERRNRSGFDEIAQRIWHLSDGRGPNWLHIASLGRQLDPENSLYALPAKGAAADLPVPDELDDGTLPEHSAALQREATDNAAESVTARENSPDASGDLAASPAVNGEPPHTAFPADAVDALNDLDMALPPRAEEPLQREVQGEAVEPANAALPDALHGIRHERSSEAVREGNPGLDASELDDDAAHESDAPHADHTDTDAQEPASAPAAVAGLGAARFGALNLAFDLDLPGAVNGAPAMAATPAQPMFSAEEIAKIARNKLELAAEYLALGDVGGARTLIHEVIESNDPGTRDDARALLATLAPLS